MKNHPYYARLSYLKIRYQIDAILAIKTIFFSLHLIQMLENEEDAALMIKEYREKSRAYEVLLQQFSETQKSVELLQVIFKSII
jgi:hypothetical protein